MAITVWIALFLAVVSAVEATCIFDEYKRYGESCQCSESCLDKSYCLRNRTGEFTCQCLPCQKFDPNLKECVEEVAEVDHCAHKPCEQICTDTGKDFKCSCRPGYVVSQSDATKCDDINECERVYYPKNCEETCADVIKADIYVLCDSSGSINSVGWGRALKFIVNLSQWLPLRPDAVQFAFGIFSSSFVHKFDLNKYTDHDELALVVNSTEHLKFATQTFLALDKINENGYLTSADRGSRPDVDKYLFLITDGRSDNTTKTLAAAERLRQQGIQIFSIGVGSLDPEELNGIAQDPQNVFNVKSYNALDSIKDKITQRVCTEVEDCKENPCEQNCVNTPGGFNCDCNDGYVVSPSDPTKCEVVIDQCKDNPCEQICTDTGNNFQCSCRPGYVISESDPTKCVDINECDTVFNARKCEETCADVIKADIYVLGDSSNSINSIGWSRELAFILNLSKWLPLRPDAAQFAFGIFSTTFEHIFDLNEYRNHDELALAVNSTEHLKSGTKTFLALDKINENGYLTSAAYGSRPDVDKYLFLITDGRSEDTTKTLAAAERLRQQGIKIFSIGVGFRDLTELHGIAKNPDHVFSVKNFNDLDTIIDKITQRVCTGVEDCKENPCEQTCINTDGGFNCTCEGGYVVSSSDPTKCEDTDECKDDPCQHDCTNTDGGYTCSCREGYEVSATDPSKCQDIDECKAVNYPPCEQVCTNIDGGYRCSCHEGYQVNVTDHSTCQDVDECKDNPCEQTCTNTDGGYTCSCREGYVVSATDPTKCEDVNECTNSPCDHTCTNTDGGYTCSCREGYEVSASDPSKCEDVNECTNSPCDHTCTNTDGGYTCSCREGYEVSATDPNKCQDVNECTNSPCDHTCTNTDGGYTCSCREGYEVSATDPNKCQDVNECTNSPCDHTCTNTDGGYTCSCREGYEVSATDPNKCQDVNECTNSPCDHACTNTDGGYTCSCREGYEVSATDPNKCQDVNECTNSPCDHACTNTDGGYTCSCREGYEVSATDPNKCQDVNECTNSPCDHACTNTDGGYTCSCREGYEVSATDPNKCQDVNECTNSPCDHACTNTDGGYTCSCREGYEVSATDPNKCQACLNVLVQYDKTYISVAYVADVNECTNSPCDHTCTNTDGGYTCSCREGYEVSATDPNKCQDVNECTNSPCDHTCTNTDGGYTCSCREGYEVSATDPNKCQDVNECTNSPCEQICTNTDGSYTCSCREGFIVSPTDPNKCEDDDECKSNPCQHICTNTDEGYTCSCKPGFVVSTSNKSKCVDINECQNSPCEQVCINSEGSYECTCEDGFISSASDPSKCNESCVDVLKADIYILADSSGSIPNTGWGRALNFIANLIKMFPLGPEAIQFGFGIFSSSFVHLFDLNRYTNQDEIAAAVLGTKQLKFETFTDLALNKINENGYLSSVDLGSRPGVGKHLFVITDGQSRNMTHTLAAAQRLKDQGINVFAVGVGLTNEKEILGIAGGKDNVFSVKNFADLAKIKNKIITRVCHEFQRSKHLLL